ncbi:MAG: glucose-1-phosphate thymidylyltransferase RfbA [Rhodospirillales bacterium]
MDGATSMKGNILAGGSGSRLDHVTRVVNTQLLPVYDKPMVHYPISILMLAGIQEFLVISNADALPSFEKLLGDGSDLGVRFSYAVQDAPRGLAEAFLIGEDFIGEGDCALALGDNIFFGHGLPDQLRTAIGTNPGATVFAYRVADPERYGIVELDGRGAPLAFEEEPAWPKSRWAVMGLYFFDNDVVDIARKVTPSARGGLEIVDIHEAYLARGKMRVEKFGRGIAWLDTGTHEALLQAAQFVETVERRQGQKISCLEEIALRMGFIDRDAFSALVGRRSESANGAYLRAVLEEIDSGR